MTKDSFLSTISLTASALIKQWANTDEVTQRLNYWIRKCACCFYRKTREHSPNFPYYFHLYSRIFAILHTELKDIQKPLTCKIQISIHLTFKLFPSFHCTMIAAHTWFSPLPTRSRCSRQLTWEDWSMRKRSRARHRFPEYEISRHIFLSPKIKLYLTLDILFLKLGQLDIHCSVVISRAWLDISLSYAVKPAPDLQLYVKWKTN